MSWLRIAGSVLGACVVVFWLLVGGLWVSGAFEEERRGPKAHPLKLIQISDRTDVSRWFTEPEPPPRAGLPPLSEIEPAGVPERVATGFVQVAFSVDENGLVTDARVLKSTHEGLYEDQALEAVRDRVHPPGIPGETRLEIVPFTVDQEAAGAASSVVE
jgi:TonB family protein